MCASGEVMLQQLKEELPHMLPHMLYAYSSYVDVSQPPLGSNDLLNNVMLLKFILKLLWKLF